MPATKNPGKKIPFLRLTIALITGIIFQWYLQVTVLAIVIYAITVLILLIVFQILPESKKFLFAWMRGILFLLLFFAVGMFATWQQNIHNNQNWYGSIYKPGDNILVTVQEPLVEKPNSYKALATVSAVCKNYNWLHSTGNILVYFKKDSAKPALHYGSEIIIKNAIQPIQNSGNPAALNYNRYCLFQNITGQTFLASKDYVPRSTENINTVQKVLFGVRDWALSTLKQNIHSPKELGIAEALLIGYRNDLDKDLVQAYSNTGVVHIIAISGLHIGVIYSSLILLFSFFKSSKIKKWVEPIIILLVIWLFTLVAGAAPSVLRATVMFTFILAGKFLGKNGNIYNTLAASAFVLLLSNPFFLWDVGFQLSYTAVLSIVIFFKSINGLFYFKNKFLRWIWQLSAVSLSAQIFTLPLVLYHFHQLPLLFLFSNLLVVPLSGIILFEELLLFGVSWWHSLASIIGWVTEISLKWMNDFVEHINKISFSVWDGLHISILQLIIMLLTIAFISFWIFNKNTKNIIAALSFILVFFILRDVDLTYHKLQQKIIVYNVSKQNAVDVIAGNTCHFIGDSVVLQDKFLRNFNIKPSRVTSRVYSTKDVLLPYINNYILQINASKILILDKNFYAEKPKEKIAVNVLILSHNFNKTPEEISNIFNCDYVVADSSIPPWKCAKWKKEFQQLHLRFFSVAQQGAFTLKL
ncbi:MAG: ComEC/Rec2 family competence protein [Parafilimonas sp.]